MKSQIVLLVVCTVIIASQVGVDAARKKSKGAKMAPTTTTATHEEKDKKFGLLGVMTGLSGLASGGLPKLGQNLANLGSSIVKGIDKFFCNVQAFTTIVRCCKSWAGPLANWTELSKLSSTCKSDSSVRTLFADYTLKNRANSQGVVDLTATATVKVFGPAVCFTECMFVNQSLYNATTGELFYDLAATNLSKPVADEWKAAVYNATIGCKNATETAAAKVPVLSVNGKNCSTKPALLVQCVRKSLYASCPSQAVQTSIPSCPTDLAKLVKCQNFTLPI